MPITQVTGAEIENQSIRREDLYTGAIAGEGVVTNLVGGDNIQLVSTGGQPGTGQVTISATSLFEEPFGSTHATLRKDSSHSIAGSCHYSGILSGVNNEIDGTSPRSLIVGGQNNYISTYNSSIVGGVSNRIETNIIFPTCHHTFIGGGKQNTITAAGSYSSIVGGIGNDVYNGTWNFIGGGKENSVGDWFSAVLTGYGNDVFGKYSTIVGGRNCDASNAHNSFIGNGYLNIIEPQPPATEVYHAAIVSGSNHYVKGDYSVTLGGDSNSIGGAANCVILNGIGNVIDDGSTHSLIGVGLDHDIEGRFSAVVAGEDGNIVNGSTHSAILSGNGNDILVSSYASAVVSGLDNVITGSNYVTVINGDSNVVESEFTTVINGIGNFVERETEHSVIFGKYNFIKEDSKRSFIHGENVWAYNFGHKAWSAGKFSTDWTSQVSEYTLRRVSGDGDGDNLPLQLDWDGALKEGAGGTGSEEVTVPSEWGNWLVECKVAAFFTYTDPPGGPIPQNRYAAFTGTFMVTWNGFDFLVNGNPLFFPIDLDEVSSHGAGSALKCGFKAESNSLRILVTDPDKNNSTYWQGYMRVTHLSIRA